MKVTFGYIGAELVKAITYTSSEAGINHYHFKGKTYAGLVKFDRLTDKQDKATQ